MAFADHDAAGAVAVADSDCLKGRGEKIKRHILQNMGPNQRAKSYDASCMALSLVFATLEGTFSTMEARGGGQSPSAPTAPSQQRREAESP